MTTCLIVEDNPLNWMIMEKHAAKLGLDVSVCVNGVEALNHCNSHPMPELILLDGSMPEMDGISFLKHMRALPNGNKPYVVFCSSSLDHDEVRLALEVGAECHFPKPISGDQIAYALKQIEYRYQKHRLNS